MFDNFSGMFEVHTGNKWKKVAVNLRVCYDGLSEMEVTGAAPLAPSSVVRDETKECRV